MAKVTKFTVAKIPKNNSAMPSNQLNLKDKFEDGVIDLSLSDLVDVPVKDIALLKKAHSLDLSNNHLSILPKNFVTLTHLIKLDLSRNELKELPDNFGDLIKLRQLDLYKNKLQHLPISFCKLKALKWLDLKDNPLLPAVANVVGPCLDNRQCQQCAKDVVTFYTGLQGKVNEERAIREAQRQKDLQAAEKLKQKEKKIKKKKDPTPKVFVEPDATTITSANDNEEKEREICDQIIVKPIKSHPFSCIRMLIMYMLTFVGFLFVLTACKFSFTESLEVHIAQLWDKFLKQSPSYILENGLIFGDYIKQFHLFTSETIFKLSDWTVSISRSDYINAFVSYVMSGWNVLCEMVHSYFNFLSKYFIGK